MILNKCFSIGMLISVSLVSAIIAKESNAPAVKEPAEPHFSWYKVVAESGLNVRNKPSTDGKILYTLPQEHTGRIWARTKSVEIIDNRPGYWFKIGENSKIGWVFSGYTYTGENSADGYWEVWDKSFHAFSLLPALKTGNRGKKISVAKTLNGEMNLYEIKGAPHKESYCGVAPRIAEIINTAESKTYQYKPLQNVNGYYTTDLNEITEILPGILAISEFNGQCNGRTRTWLRLVILGKNGAFTVVQDLEETTPFCGGEGGETTLRRVLIDKTARRILIFEREGDCLKRAENQDKSSSDTTPYYGPPKYITISIENSIASRVEYTKKTLPAEVRGLFSKLEKKIKSLNDPYF